MKYIYIYIFVLFCFFLWVASRYISEKYWLDNNWVSLITIALTTPVILWMLSKIEDEEPNDTSNTDSRSDAD